MKTRRDTRANEAGWTLIELMVVMSLIIVLSTLALAQYKNSIRQTKEAVLKADLFHMREAIDQYYADKGSYPSSLQTLESEGYLRGVR
jgi:general secretion pathway protein G